MRASSCDSPLLFRFSPHGAHQRIDHSGIKLCAGRLLNQAQRLLLLHPLAIGAIRKHRIQRIRYSQYARVLRYFLTLELVRIAGSIVALVVVAYHINDFSVKLDLRGDIRPDDRMGFDMFAFF